MQIGHSGYHDVVFSPRELKATVNRVVKNLKNLKKKLKFNAIAFRGASGAGVAFPVSAITGIPVIYVRKKNESTHGCGVEGPDTPVRRYIILDDFVDSGKTVKAIIKEITKQPVGEVWNRQGEIVNEVHPECVGVCLYDYTSGPTIWVGKKNIPIYDV